jgi:hypothetical protein
MSRIHSLFLLLSLAGCLDSGPSPAIKAAAAAAAQAGAPVAQSFEVSIDGVPLVMSPDAPRKGHLVMAGIVGGRQLALSAMDQGRDFALVISVEPKGAGPLTAGGYISFTCSTTTACDALPSNAPRPLGSMLTPYPNGKVPPVGAGKEAHMAPALGLSPLTLTLDKVEDAYWPGVGPSKRVKGSFSGTLAYVELRPDAPPTIVGPVKNVEGKFDLYTVLR